MTKVKLLKVNPKIKFIQITTYFFSLLFMCNIEKLIY